MAGGQGTRLWPVSRKNKPKQVLPFIGQKTLLQETFDRLVKIFDPQDIFIVANISQEKELKKQLPDFILDNFIFESVGRNTAPAIGLAAVKFYQQNPEENFITINSDAYVKDQDEYLRILKTVELVLNKYPSQPVLVGLKPDYPETGYGYIKIDETICSIDNEKTDTIYSVEKFVEKPELQTAKKYIDDGRYLWNPALFGWQAKTLLKKFEEFLPDHHSILMKILHNIENQDKVNELFEQFENISIDFGIMEKLDDILVIPAKFGWSDIGNWRSVKDVQSEVGENLIKGEFVGEDNSGNLIYNFTDKLVSAVGLKNMIIVQTQEILLICPKEKAQEVKKIVEKLKKENKINYL